MSTAGFHTASGSLNYGFSPSAISPGDLNVGDVLIAGDNFTDTSAVTPTDPHNFTPNTSLAGVTINYHWWVGGVDMGVDLDGKLTITAAMMGQQISLGATFSDKEVVNTNLNHQHFATTNTATPTLVDTTYAYGTDLESFILAIGTVNNAPSADNESASVNEQPATIGTAASGNVLSGDVDADTLDTLTVVGVAAGTAGSPGSGGAGSVAGAYGTLTITASGAYDYQLDNADTAVNGLNTGDTLHDIFKYRVSDGNGGWDTGTVDITINGSNDSAVFSGDFAGSVVEAIGPSNSLSGTSSDTGAFSTSDVDNTAPFNAVASGVAGYGTYKINASGVWTYTLDNSNLSVDQLTGYSDTLTDSFQITADDGTIQNVVITIHGANDAAVITGNFTATVTEDGGLSNTVAGVGSDSGTVNVSDVDGADSLSYVLGAAAAHGNYSVFASGAWYYSLNQGDAAVQALNTGDSTTDSFQIHADDGTTKTINVTIWGQNDAATFSGTFVGDVTERGGFNNGAPGVLGESGTGYVNDVDNTSDLFSSAVITQGSSHYGTLSITASGAWNYTLDDSLAAVEALASWSDTMTDTFQVSAADGTLKNLTITIHGANDEPTAVDDTFTVSAYSTTAQQNLVGNDIDKDSDTMSVVSFDGFNVQTSPFVTSSAWGSWSQSGDNFFFRLDTGYAGYIALSAGQTTTLHHTYKMETASGTSYGDISIVVQGIDELPRAANLTDYVLTEDVNTTFSSTFVLTDADNSAASIQVIGVELVDLSASTTQADSNFNLGLLDVTNAWGEFHITASGNYFYTVDNNSALVQGLKAGEHVYQQVRVQLEGASSTTNWQTFTIDLAGRNDKPAIGALVYDAYETGIGVQTSTTSVDVTANVFSALTGSGDPVITDADHSFTLEVFRLDNVLVTTTFTNTAAFGGTVSITQAGGFHYHVDQAFLEGLGVSETTSVAFALKVRDESGGIGSGFITVDIHGANDGPMIATSTISGSTTNYYSASTVNLTVTDAGATTDSGSVAFVDPDLSDNPLVVTLDGNTRTGNTVSAKWTYVMSSATYTMGTLYMTQSGNYWFDLDATGANYLSAAASTTHDFSFKISDNHGVVAGTDMATIHVVVNGANDAPTAADHSYSAMESGATTSGSDVNVPSSATDNLLAGAVDTDSGATFHLVGIETTSGAYLLSGSATVSSNVVGHFSATTGGAFNFQVNETFFNGLADGSVTDIVLSYKLADSLSATDTANITIHVNGANDNPTAYDDSNTIAAGATSVSANVLDGRVVMTSLSLTSSTIGMDTDPDNGFSLSVVGVNDGSGSFSSVDPTSGFDVQGVYGTLHITVGGHYTYFTNPTDPDLIALPNGSTGTDSFQYRVADGLGGFDTGTLDIHVVGSNSPIVVNTNIVATASDVANTTGNNGTNTTGSVLSGVTDPDGDTMTVVGVGSDSITSSGSYSQTTPFGTLWVSVSGAYSFSYDETAINALTANFSTSIDFAIYLTDGNSGSATQHLFLNVYGANEKPTATSFSGGVTAATGSNVLFGSLTFSDSDTGAGVTAGDTVQVTAIDGFTSAVGTAHGGQYGFLHVSAGGDLTYTANLTDSDVIALGASETGTEHFTYTVSDGHGGTDTDAITIRVYGVNDVAMLVDNSNSILDVSMNSSSASNPVANVLLNDTDPDVNDSLSVTGVTFGSAFHATGTFFTTVYGDFRIWSTGSYTMIADQAAIDALSVSFTDTLTFTVNVTDGHGGGGTEQLYIQVFGANDPVSAFDDSGTILATSAGSGDVTAGTVSMTDVDVGDSPRVVAVSGSSSNVSTWYHGAFGQIRVWDTGSWSYDGDSGANPTLVALGVGETTTDVYTVTVSDLHGATDTAQISVYIQGVNDAVVRNDDSNTLTDYSYTSSHNTPTGWVLSNDSDADLNDNIRITYTSSGTSFLLGTSAWLTLTNTYGTLHLRGDGYYSFDANEGALDALSISASTDIVFTFNVTDTRAGSWHGGGGAEHLTIHLFGGNESPSASMSSISDSLTEDAALPATGNVISDANVTDVDNGDTLFIANAGTHISGNWGYLSITAGGDYQYHVSNSSVQWLGASNSASDVFHFTVSDGHSGTTGVWLTINIDGQNDAMTLTNETRSLTDVAYSPSGVGDLTGNMAFSDVDTSDSHSVTAVHVGTLYATQTGPFSPYNIGSAYGTLHVGKGGHYTFDVNESAVNALGVGASAQLDFSVSVTDWHGGGGVEHIIINLQGANDAPVFNATSSQYLSVTEDSWTTTSGNIFSGTFSGMFTDPDIGDTLSAYALSGVTITGTVESQTTPYGTFYLHTNGDVTFHLDQSATIVQALGVGETATLTFDITVTDGNGGTAQGDIQIFVYGTNDSPTAHTDYIGGRIFTTSLSGTSSTGTFLSASNTFESGNLISGGTSGEADFDIDGDTMTVVGVNSSGFASNYVISDIYGGQLSVTHSGHYNYQLNASDIDYIMLAEGETATVLYHYTISDGWSGTSTADILITVVGINDAAVANDLTVTFTEDAAPYTLTGTVSITDPDGTTGGLSVVGLIGASSTSDTSTFHFAGRDWFTITDAYGVFHIAVGGEFYYTLDNAGTAVQSIGVGQSVSHQMHYRVSDGMGGTSTADLNILIHGANDAPQAGDLFLNVYESGSVVSGQDLSTNIFNVTASSNLVISEIDFGDTLSVFKFDFQNPVVTFTNSYGSGSITGGGWVNFHLFQSMAEHLGVSETVQFNYQYKVQDNHGVGSALGDLTIVVQGANDGPTANGESISITEDGAPVAGTLLGNDTDPDSNDVLQVDAVAWSANPTSSAVLASTVAGQFGDLHITAGGSFSYVLDQSSTALQGLGGGELGYDYFYYRITDQHGGFDTATLTVTVTGNNDAPVAFDHSFSSAQDSGTLSGTWVSGTGASGNVLTDATDLDGDTVTVVGLWDGTGYASQVSSSWGTANITASGNFSFVANQSFSSPVNALGAGQTHQLTFTYQVTDGNSATDVEEIFVTIHGANDEPTAQNATLTVTAQGAMTDWASLSYADPDNSDTVNVTAVDGSSLLPTTSALYSVRYVTDAYGQFEIWNTGYVDFNLNGSSTAVLQLAAGSWTVDTFQYTVADAGGLTATASVDVIIWGANDGPTASSISLSAQESGSTTSGYGATTNVLSYVFDWDNGDTAHANGLYNGSTYVQTLTGAWGTAVLTASGNFSLNLNEAYFDSLSVSAMTGLDFTYQVADASSATDTSSIHITVYGANDAPTGTSVSVSMTEDDSSLTGNLLSSGSASDVDAGDSLHLLYVGGAGSSGFATGSYGWLTFTSGGAYNYHLNTSGVQHLSESNWVTETFSYVVTDGHGGTYSTNLYITIEGVNDAPTAVDDVFNITESGVLMGDVLNGHQATVSAAFTGTDVDVDDSTSLTLWDVNAGTGSNAFTSGMGSFTFGSSGSFTFSADSSHFGYLGVSESTAVTFDYTVRDSHSATSVGTITVYVHGVNDAPTAVDDSRTITEDASFISGNALTGTSYTSGASSNDHDTDINDVLVVTNAKFSTSQSLTVPGSGTAVTLHGYYGDLHITAGGDWSYLLATVSDTRYTGVQSLTANTFGYDTFTYTISDGHGGHDVASIWINVDGMNDAPVAVDDSFSVSESVTGSGATNVGSYNVLSNDTDPDSTYSLTLASMTGGAGSHGFTSAMGNFTYTSSGNFTFTADSSFFHYLGAGDVATVTFDYLVRDEWGGTDVGTVTVYVNGLNSSPTAVSDIANVTEDGISATGNVIANDLDADPSDILVVTYVYGSFASSSASITSPSDTATIHGHYGDLIIQGDGDWSYVLATVSDTRFAGLQGLSESQLAHDNFEYWISDQQGGSDSAWLSITVTGVNDAPTVSDVFSSAQESGFSVSASSASGNFLSSASATDWEGDTLSIVGVDSASGTQFYGAFGTLTITASGSWSYHVNESLASFLTASSSTTDVFHVAVSDGNGGVTTADLNVVVHGANDTPTANLDDVYITEQGVSNSVANYTTGNVVANDTDVDSPHSSLLAISLDGNLPTSFGFMAEQGNYGWFYLSGGGAYSFQLDESNATVQALTSSTSITDTFHYKLSDGNGATTTASIVVHIQGANDAPTGVDDHDVAGEMGYSASGYVATGNVLSNDVDVDSGASLHVDLSTSSVTIEGDWGTLHFTTGGNYLYNVDNTVADSLSANQTVTDTFTYTVVDEHGANDIAHLYIHVSGVNDGPVAGSDSGSAMEMGASASGSAATGNLLTNDTDVDNNAVIHVGQVGSQSLSASFTSQSFTFTTSFSYTFTYSGTFSSITNTHTYTNVHTNTHTNYFGNADVTVAGLYGDLHVTIDGDYSFLVDNSNATVNALAVGESLSETFSYWVEDEHGAQGLGHVTIHIQGANDAPTGSADSASATNGHTATGNVLSNDTDPDHSYTLSAGAFDSTTAFGHLHLTSSGGYTFDVNESNATILALSVSDTTVTTFTYTVFDEYGASDTAQLMVTIWGVNDAPTAVDDSGTAHEAGVIAGVAATGNLLSNDLDPDNSATLHAGAGTFTGQYGMLYVTAGGDYSYVVNDTNATVDALAFGSHLTETFSYTLYDSHSASDIGHLSIQIVGANDAPVASADTITASEAGTDGGGSNGVGNLLGNDTDVDTGHVLSVASVTFTSAMSPTVTIAGLHGDLKVTVDGDVRYFVDNSDATVDALALGQHLTETFTYVVADSNSATDTGTLIVYVNGQNDGPVGVDDTDSALEAGIAAGSNATGNVISDDTDVDAGHVLHAVANTFHGNYGTLYLTANGHYTYDLDDTKNAVNQLSVGDTLQDTFNYKVADEHGATDIAQLTITINGGNDAPVASGDALFVTETGYSPSISMTAMGNLLTNDSDVDIHDTLSVWRVAGNAAATTSAHLFHQVGSWGTLTVSASGDYVYNLDNSNATVDALSASQSLTDTFSYQVSDGHGGHATASLVVHVQGANDGPVAVSDTDSATEGGESSVAVDATGDVLANDSDVDNNTLLAVAAVNNNASAVGVATYGLYGWLTLGANGSYTYHADDTNALVNALKIGQSTTDTFTYTVTDEHGAVATTTLTITLHGVNDGPSGTLSIGGVAIAGQVLSAVNNLSDPEGISGGFTYQWTANGNDIVGANGTTFLMTQAYAGQTMGLRVTYTDDGGTAESASATLAGVNGLILKGTSRTDRLVGSNLNDDIDGGGGRDSMEGLDGSDIYHANDSGDIVIEKPNEGVDTVISTANFTLPVNVENLVLQGTAATGKGNDLANSISGNNSANTLTGLGGADTLTGGLGADTFVFNSNSDSNPVHWDVITDFSIAQKDRIDLRLIDAKEGVVGNQAFKFIGTTAFNPLGNNIGLLRFDPGTSMLLGSTDADADAEIQIELVGITNVAGIVILF